jgi:hypothetical protein
VYDPQIEEVFEEAVATELVARFPPLNMGLLALAANHLRRD